MGAFSLVLYRYGIFKEHILFKYVRLNNNFYFMIYDTTRENETEKKLEL